MMCSGAAPVPTVVIAGQLIVLAAALAPPTCAFARVAEASPLKTWSVTTFTVVPTEPVGDGALVEDVLAEGGGADRGQGRPRVAAAAVCGGRVRRRVNGRALLDDEHVVGQDRVRGRD